MQKFQDRLATLKKEAAERTAAAKALTDAIAAGSLEKLKTVLGDAKAKGSAVAYGLAFDSIKHPLPS